MVSGFSGLEFRGLDSGVWGFRVLGSLELRCRNSEAPASLATPCLNQQRILPAVQGGERLC